MINLIKSYAEKKFTIAEAFNYCDSTCILENGKIAFCAGMDGDLFDKVNKKGFLLCFTIDNDGETNIEYIRANTPATPCNVEITVD